jgi:hypothetical protein
MSKKTQHEKEPKKDQALVASEGSGDIAVIGEGTPNRTPVSLQVLQSIYHEITGKKEEVSKSYDEPYIITISEFEQLNLRILQTCEQYHIKALTTEFKIYYINDTQDTFSSFERFKAFNAGSDSSVESVLLKYNFLILLPKINQPQSYTITIRVASRIAIDKKMNSELFEMPKILKVLGSRIAIVTIEYIDYVVARTFLNVIDGWFKVLPCTSMPAWLKKVKKHSGYFPLLFKYAVGAIVAVIIFQIIPVILKPTSTLPTFANFVFAAFVGLFAAYKIGGHLGRATESSIDDWTALSYIQFTAGDKKEIDTARTANKWAISKVVASFAGSILISIAAKIIANIIIDIVSKHP